MRSENDEFLEDAEPGGHRRGDTVAGYAQAPVVVGCARTLGFQLAARSEQAPATNSTSAVIAIDPAPILAQFAFPNAGQVDDVYTAAADTLERGQQYHLKNGYRQ